MILTFGNQVMYQLKTQLIHEGGLTLLSICGFAGQHMIGDGADAQGPLPVTGGIHIKGGRLHFQSHNPHFLQVVNPGHRFRYIRIVDIKDIGRIDISHVISCTVLSGSFHGSTQQFKGSNGGKGAGHVEIFCKIGIGTGSLSKYQIIKVHIFLNGSGRADPDNIFYIIEIIQLMGINAHGGHAHAGGHHGDSGSLVGAGVTLNTPDIIDKYGIFQIGFRNESGTEGVSGHQYGFGEVAGFCTVMRGHENSSFYKFSSGSWPA